MHHCFNAVVEPEGVGAAVLVRGVEPLVGFAPGARTDGPGRLCRAMGITLAHNRTPLVGEGPLHLEAGQPVSVSPVAEQPPRAARGE
jgi:DNA-3-methyladenine glycosylase